MLAALAQPTALVLAASKGSFLIKPGIGLMVWTLLVFGVTMVLLSQARLPAHQRGARTAQARIEESIDTAERTREEADELLAEYRERLKEARAQAEEIVQRARQAADAHEHEAKERGQEILAEAAKRAERDIEAATKRALDDIRREVADLTILATEKVTRKTLDTDDQKRLVEEALGELDFSGDLARRVEQLMEELAQVYARSLFEVAREQGKLDELREQLGQFADALDANRELAVFFFSPYFSTQEKQDALERMLDGADEMLPELPQAADREPPHAGDLPHAPAVRAPVGAGEPAAAGRDHERDRARPGDDREPRAARSASAPGAR